MLNDFMDSYDNYKNNKGEGKMSNGALIVCLILSYIVIIYWFNLPYLNAGIEKIEKAASNEELIKTVYAEKLEEVEGVHYSYPNEGEIVISNIYEIISGRITKEVVNDKNYILLKVDDNGNILSREEHYQSAAGFTKSVVIITVIFLLFFMILLGRMLKS